MRIAVPTVGDNVDDHFGHCKEFTIFQVDNNKVTNKEVEPSLQGCGCKSNIIETLLNKGVNVFLAGNIGQGAFNKINNSGIKVIRGCSGSVDSVVQSYLNGEIHDNFKLCSPDDGHDCAH